MRHLRDTESLLTHLGPVLYARDRRAALKKAGFVVDKSVPARVRAALRLDPLGLPGRVAASTVAGPTVPITCSMARATARQADPRTINGFDVVGTVFLSTFEEIVAKLWESLVYPQDVTPGDTRKLFDVDEMRSCFSGVPDGAEIGTMLVPAPPRLRVAGPDLLEVTQPVRVQLTAPDGAVVELITVAVITFPVVMIATSTVLGLDTFVIPNRTHVEFLVDPASQLQPLDAARLESFETQMAPKVGAGVGAVLRELKRSPVFDVPGGFSGSKLRIVSASVWLSRWDNEDQVTFGVLVEPEPEDRPRREPPTPAQLAPLADLFRPDTVSLVVSESLIERGLRSVVATGQLEDRLSEKLEWLQGFELPHRIEIRRVDVRLDDQAIKVGLDCRYNSVCAFGTDFDFRATVDLTPEIARPSLKLRSDGIDIDLDNVDTVLCVLTSPLTGPWGFLLLTLGSAIAAAVSPPFNRSSPAFWQGNRLPESDVFPRIDLTSVGLPTTGVMHLSGTFGLAPDEISTFVVTQVLAVDQESGEVRVVENATVALTELGAPPPAGDDYVPPDDFTGERTEDDGTVVQVTGTYQGDFADASVGTDASERHGLARFAVPLDDVGGSFSLAEKHISPAGQIFTTHRVELTHGDAPDLAATVTLTDGFVPIDRQLIALNLGERRLGTVQDPVRLVYADRCIPERHAVTAAEAKVARIQANLDELREELKRVPPSEKEPIRKAIRRIEQQFLPPAIEERRAARAARAACMAEPG